MCKGTKLKQDEVNLWPSCNILHSIPSIFWIGVVTKHLTDVQVQHGEGKNCHLQVKKYPACEISMLSLACLLSQRSTDKEQLKMSAVKALTKSINRGNASYCPGALDCILIVYKNNNNQNIYNCVNLYNLILTSFIIPILPKHSIYFRQSL